MFQNFYKNKKIIITGHTGFKGSWLCLWLSLMGAKVYGISINKTKLFKIFSGKNIKSSYFDVRNIKKLKQKILTIKPDIIFHLAAQSLVGESFKDPLYTWSTNVLGTINILESVKNYKKKCTLIIITSDKAYKNIETKKGYKENDILHGIDPYSASKSCADIAAQSYIKTIIKKNNLRFGIARAGNVIGGGDFSENRIIPDFIKSVQKKKYLKIRNKNSTRPWQHVLEPLGGYLTFALKISSKQYGGLEILNFGPKKKNNYKVVDLIKNLKTIIPNKKIIIKKKNLFKESKLLKLNSNLAYKKIKWKPTLNFHETIKFTGLWYKSYLLNKNKKILKKLSVNQISEYYLKFKLKNGKI